MNTEQPNQLQNLTTEGRNPASSQIDTLTALEIVQLMNAQDSLVAKAVEQEADHIAAAIDVIADRFRIGGRLIYMGAGTSGRLGVLDASECPPTFSTPPEMVIGLIAGGPSALTRAIEGAEDHPELGRTDLQQVRLCDDDVVVGIATSGRTPYVLGGLQHAKEIGAVPIGFCCNSDSIMRVHCDIMIAPVVGPEVISGSTRMKAGTATKMVLNMLTTGAMVRLGKTFGNLMVDLKATNEKLTLRSRRIVSELAEVDWGAAGTLLEQSGGDVKTAIVMHLLGVNATEAREVLNRSEGHLRHAIGNRFE